MFREDAFSSMKGKKNDRSSFSLDTGSDIFLEWFADILIKGL